MVVFIVVQANSNYHPAISYYTVLCLSVKIFTSTGGGMSKTITTSLFILFFISGCANSSSDIRSAYVSPAEYQSYDCDQLSAEFHRIQARVVQLGERLDDATRQDGELDENEIIFLPELYAMGRTKQQQSDYALMKGQYNAVQQEFRLKECDLTARAHAPI